MQLWLRPFAVTPPTKPPKGPLYAGGGRRNPVKDLPQKQQHVLCEHGGIGVQQAPELQAEVLRPCSLRFALELCQVEGLPRITAAQLQQLPEQLPQGCEQAVLRRFWGQPVTLP